MSIPKIFATGITGYVGGDALFALLSSHPTWEPSITALVRSPTKGALVQAIYPSIKLVYGSLEDSFILENEAANADLVLNWADSDHIPSTEALVRGARRRAEQGKEVYLIHTSGTGILTWNTVATQTWGLLEDKLYDDWDGIGEVTSLPDQAAHRAIDKIVLDAGSEHGLVKTAIVCPPTIYGLGRGPGNTRSQQLYELSRLTLLAGKGLRVRRGENRQTHVHVEDLSDLYVLLVEDAVHGGARATWGEKGYYFCSNGEQSWGEMAGLIAKESYKQGFIPTDEVVEFSEGELAESAGHSNAALIYGGNAREKTVRARKLLGFDPSRRSIYDEIPDAVAAEAVRLGMVKKY